MSGDSSGAIRQVDSDTISGVLSVKPLSARQVGVKKKVSNEKQQKKIVRVFITGVLDFDLTNLVQCLN